jgi:hypothetical protein
MGDEERMARAGRDRRAPSGIPDSARRIWAKRAEQLERHGMELIGQATQAPVVKSRANGQQMSAKLIAGLKLLEAADKLWARLGRLGGPPAAKSIGTARPPSLAAYRKQRQADANA